MELKAGYKQTEIGVIPEDWSLSILNDAFDVRDGTHESPSFIKNGIPLVTSKNIINGVVDLNDVNHSTRRSWIRR